LLYLAASGNPDLQYVVITMDLMFKKISDLWWVDKLHVEMYCGSDGSCDNYDSWDT